MGDLAVHMDSMILNPQAAMANLKAIQLNAILVANKKLLGLVSIAGFFILIYIYFHHFGRIKHAEVRLIRVLKGKSYIARRRRREQQLLKETINQLKDAGGATQI